MQKQHRQDVVKITEPKLITCLLLHNPHAAKRAIRIQQQLCATLSNSDQRSTTVEIIAAALKPMEIIPHM